MRRSKGIRRRNPKRRASEFARCYHSKERVEFVKSLPCVACGRGGLSENAHIETGGMGRKSGFEKIVPLCGYRDRLAHGCHRLLDERMGRARFEKTFKINLDDAAAETERLWLAKSLRRAWLAEQEGEA